MTWLQGTGHATESNNNSRKAGAVFHHFSSFDSKNLIWSRDFGRRSFLLSVFSFFLPLGMRAICFADFGGLKR